MIPFPHVWRSDPAGVVRCYRPKRYGEDESATLAGALAFRLREAVKHLAAAEVHLGAAKVRLHGWGVVAADGVAALLDQAERDHGELTDRIANVETAAADIMGMWEAGEPADYAAAREASRARLREQFPHADLSILS